MIWYFRQQSEANHCQDYKKMRALLLDNMELQAILDDILSAFHYQILVIIGNLLLNNFMSIRHL